MSLRIQRSDWFAADVEHYADWYTTRGGWDLASRYLQGVNATLMRLGETPTLGHLVRFQHPELRGVRCMRVERPFQKHLLFYRNDETTLYAERAIHGARDLERRLLEAPTGADDVG